MLKEDAESVSVPQLYMIFAIPITRCAPVYFGCMMCTCIMFPGQKINKNKSHLHHISFICCCKNGFFHLHSVKKNCAELTMREEYGFLMISCFVLAEWPLDCLLKVMTDNCLLQRWYQRNALTCKLMLRKSFLFVLEFIWPRSDEVSETEEWSGDHSSFLQCSCLSVSMKLTDQHGFRLFAFTFCVQQNLLLNMT